jgi:hypothetical protein
MRCARCGNENPDANRFCGMCGATLLQPSAGPTPTGSGPTVSSPGPASFGPATPAPVAASTGAPVSSHSLPAARAATASRDVAPSSSPGISGPSFLGLNDPPPAKPRRGGLSIDPGAAPSSRSLDYLLEDEEEPKGGGAWKVLLIVLALGLAAGFGYLRWKNQGLPWLGSGAAKPTVAAPSAETSDSNPATPAASEPASSAPTTSPSATGTAGGPSQANPSASQSPVIPPTAPAQAGPADASPAPASGNGADSGGANAAAPPSNDSAAPATPAPAAPKPEPAPRKPASVPPAKPQAATVQPRVDSVNEAKRYLYGQGVPQNCDRGLRLLKPAADQANTKAMIEMGALYSAGLCTPRDLPTAYRWFALALRKDPENVPLQADLQKLWGEMTQPERQLAIKLSQ